ncbi:MAG: DUF6298 domain-containing protein [Candidatus Omnitrophota bacterium]
MISARFKMGILASIGFILLYASAFGQSASGPLRVCESNPRYFCGGGKAILLTGSHVWNNFVDMGESDPPAPFDYAAYLDWMKKLNHNFIRLWTWELASWNTTANQENKRLFSAPQPWLRTGPEKALDGKPKFDLNRFDPAYFERLRDRVKAAGDKGIYVSIMLFEGWAMQFMEGALKSHPFHPANNINNINCDRNDDGKGLEIHELAISAITALQENYVRKVVDSVNNLDNVLYEISNENHPPSTPWQYHMINFIHQYEKNKPKQHPVGMTFQYKGGSNQTLFDSPADWISPNPDGGYRDDPPANDGRKVILNDTDHLWGIGGNEEWAWKSFLRGCNPIFMDPYDGVVLGKPFEDRFEALRRNMGCALKLSQKVNLAAMTPRNDLSSAKYCLAEPGRTYIVYIPKGEKAEVDLSAVKGKASVEWLNIKTGDVKKGGDMEGGKKQTFASPFAEAAILHIEAAAS